MVLIIPETLRFTNETLPSLTSTALHAHGQARGRGRGKGCQETIRTVFSSHLQESVGIVNQSSA